MDQFLTYLMDLDPVVQGIAGLATTLALPWLLTKIKKAYLKRAVELAVIVVRSVYQTYVSELKKARPDGLTEEEKKHALNMAVKKLKAMLFNSVVVGWLFGGNGKLDALLADVIEGGVNAVKKASKVPEITTVNPPPLPPEPQS